MFENQLHAADAKLALVYWTNSSK